MAKRKRAAEFATVPVAIMWPSGKREIVFVEAPFVYGGVAVIRFPFPPYDWRPTMAANGRNIGWQSYRRRADAEAAAIAYVRKGSAPHD